LEGVYSGTIERMGADDRETREKEDGNRKLPKLETREPPCKLSRIITTTCFRDNFGKYRYLSGQVLLAGLRRLFII